MHVLGAVPYSGRPSPSAAAVRVAHVSRIFASWNQLEGWLRQVEYLRTAA